MRVLLVAVIVLALAAALYVALRPAPPPSLTPQARPVTSPFAINAPPQPGAGPPTAEPGAAKAGTPESMVFSREGINAGIAQAVEQVCGKGNSLIAVSPRGEARWICIVAPEERRYYRLDEGLRAEDFPALADGNFVEPPEPILRTMSIYRSVAKTAMGYRADKGDRIIVLLCPKTDWPMLKLQWPR